MRIASSVIISAMVVLSLLPGRLQAQGNAHPDEALAAADAAWDAGRFDDALALYQDVLRHDSLSTRAMYRVATVLARRRDFDAAVTLFHKYSALRPRDADGHIALARTLAWSGRYSEAIGVCDSLSAANPANRDAVLLGAQVLAWSGDRAQAITRYEHWLATHSSDAEAWAGLSKTWKWSGRPDRAQAALRRAVAADPANTDVRAALEREEALVRPSVEPMIGSTNDSDDNSSMTYVTRASLTAPGRTRVTADASYRTAEFAAQRAHAVALRATTTRSSTDDRWSMHGAAGAERLDGDNGVAGSRLTHVEPLLAAGISVRPLPALSLGASVIRSVLDETAPVIAAAIASTEVQAEASALPHPRLRITADGDWTRLNGGSGANARHDLSAGASWSLLSSLSVGVAGRTFSYAHAANDGYFTPRRFLLAEATARWKIGGDLGWHVESELGLGSQSITAFAGSTIVRFAQRYSSSVAYSFTPGMEWRVGGGFANAASPTTINAANYRIMHFSIGGRLRL